MAAFVLMERKFAPPDDRLRSLIAREKQMPALLAAARVNLKNPPRIFTEIAIEQLPDIISFFQHDVPLGLCRRKRSGAESGIRADQRRRHRRAQRLSRLAEDRSAAALQRRLPHRRRYLLRRSSHTTRWSICRSTSCSKSAGPICARTRSTSSRSPTNLSRTKIRARCLKSWARQHPAPDQLLDAFRATFDGLVELHPRASHRHHSVRCAAHRRRDAALHARHDLCQHGHARAPSRRTRPRPTSTSRCPIP